MCLVVSILLSKFFAFVHSLWKLVCVCYTEREREREVHTFDGLL